MSLLRWLLDGTAGGVSEKTLRARLHHPAGFPASPALKLQSGARTLPRADEVSSMSAGEALAVGIECEGLFSLAPTRPRTEYLELRGTAAASARLAHRLVTRDLPVLTAVDTLHRAPHWAASLLGCSPGSLPPTALDGESYGLALALGTASFVLDLPMRETLVASAALNADSTLAPVEGIDRKLALVLTEAPGVTRFLVAEEQRAEAVEALDQAHRALASGLDPWLAIVSVRTFQDAFTVAFPRPIEVLRERWRDPRVADRLIAELGRAALWGTPMVLGWPAVATCARELATPTRTDAQRTLLDRVAAIADRHSSKGGRLAWPDAAELAALPRAQRLRLLAHVVQSAADSGVDPGLVASRARALVRPALERAPEDAVLLGAIGRALALTDDHAGAADALRGSIDAWAEVGSPEESSYALCELLRILGCRGDQDAVLALVGTEVAEYTRDPRSAEKSLGYLRVAAGRALVQVGLSNEALVYLADDGDWPPLPPQCEGACQRWRARALDGLGRAKEADACRDDLDAKESRGDALALQVRLARLDRARRDGGSTEALLHDLAELPEAKRTLGRCPPGVDPVHHLAEQIRY